MSFARREGGTNASVCHYLDGMPVKIGEKFRPPRKITLPLSYQQHYPVDLLSEEYDFSLESQVLELAQTKRHGREVAERAKVEKLGTSIEEFTRMVCGDPKNSDENWDQSEDNGNSQCEGYAKRDSSSPHDYGKSNGSDPTLSGSKNGLVVGIATSLLTSLEPNSMLTPVPMTNEPSAVSDKPDVTLTSKFNIEDFEAESSPFDSVELKTLNDIEELKSVLQNAHMENAECAGRGSADRPSNHELQSNAETFDDTRLTRHGREVFKEDQQRQNGPDRSHRMSQHDQPFSANFSAVPPTVSQSVDISNSHHYCNLPSVGPPHPKCSAFACGSPSQSSLHSVNALDGQSAHGGGCTSIPSVQAQSQANLDSPLPTNISSDEEIYTCVFPLLNSRSTPDLLKELGVALATDREKKKNPPCSNQAKRQSTAGHANSTASEQMEDHLSENLEKSPSSKKSGAKTSSSNSNLDLDAEAMQLISHITDMGFPRARVTLVIQNLGKDDKKAVEYLCFMQSFIERGYIPGDVECGVLLFGHNEPQVKEYLEIMIQFRDLGFEDDSIKMALEQSSYDREKALDFLLS